METTKETTNKLIKELIIEIFKLARTTVLIIASIRFLVYISAETIETIKSIFF